MRLEEIAKEKERKGRKVWVQYGKIRIEGQWWKWDEEEEVLRDARGMKREAEAVEKREGRKGRVG